MADPTERLNAALEGRYKVGEQPRPNESEAELCHRGSDSTRDWVSARRSLCLQVAMTSPQERYHLLC